jgi:uncharacterized membrane protein YgdD (TMEM256/DUF423 family)
MMIREATVTSSRKFLRIAAAFGFTGVAFGAFGAHALRSTISTEMLSVFETGVRYQMYHAFALFVAAWFLQTSQSSKFEIAAWLFVAGVILFSGSLYALAMTGIHSLGFITPFGGLSFLAGWLVLGLGFWEKKPGQ